ncbi:MAG TPA: Smr/MutS family protein [Bauldia sp.]|nr:Smr/MutS family protein [Bauldia sp.]
MARRSRTLSGEERRLWELVAGAAKPLKPLPPKPAKREPTATAPRASAGPAAPPAASSVTAKPKPMPGAIDHKTRTRLMRGGLEVEGRLDLHGLTQGPAHQRLLAFLTEAQARGTRLVLVITGKGDPEARTDGERGVLRRAVPAWLSSVAFRSLVAGFGEAGRRHGGAGALYVRVKRRERA